MIPRVVVDSNLLIGAVLSKGGGDNREVLRRCLQGLAKPVLGVALFSEYEDLLGREKLMKECPLPPKDQRALLEAFIAVCEWIKLFYLWRPNLPDESGNHLIEIAVAGTADFIITNNLRDLNTGELHFPNLKILSPKQFIQTTKTP
ncbi:putative toxin-antitoxin system toxin component, PIN family [soil metagenome]